MLGINLAGVLVVSDSCISSAHDTGTLALRYFSGCLADKIAHAHCAEAGQIQT
jgi:hypothetical protein